MHSASEFLESLMKSLRDVVTLTCSTPTREWFAATFEANVSMSVEEIAGTSWWMCPHCGTGSQESPAFLPQQARDVVGPLLLPPSDTQHSSKTTHHRSLVGTVQALADAIASNSGLSTSQPVRCSACGGAPNETTQPLVGKVTHWPMVLMVDVGSAFIAGDSGARAMDAEGIIRLHDRKTNTTRTYDLVAFVCFLFLCEEETNSPLGHYVTYTRSQDGQVRL